jgi:hypothetical protein
VEWSEGSLLKVLKLQEHKELKVGEEEEREDEMDKRFREFVTV